MHGYTSISVRFMCIKIKTNFVRTAITTAIIQEIGLITGYRYITQPVFSTDRHIPARWFIIVSPLTSACVEPGNLLKRDWGPISSRNATTAWKIFLMCNMLSELSLYPLFVKCYYVTKLNSILIFIIYIFFDIADITCDLKAE